MDYEELTLAWHDGENGGLQQCLLLLQTGFVRRALELSLQDSDDLFFEGGQTVRELLDALVSHQPNLNPLCSCFDVLRGQLHLQL